MPGVFNSVQKILRSNCASLPKQVAKVCERNRELFVTQPAFLKRRRFLIDCSNPADANIAL
jgi:hypothetical protein